MDTNATVKKLINAILTLEILIQAISLNNPKPEVVYVMIQCVHEEPSSLALQE